MLAWGGQPTLSDDLEALRDRIGADKNELDWGAFRREFELDAKITFLNTGSIGCTPRFVLDQIHLAAWHLERDPFHHVWEDGLAGGLEIGSTTSRGFFWSRPIRDRLDGEYDCRTACHWIWNSLAERATKSF